MNVRLLFFVLLSLLWAGPARGDDLRGTETLDGRYLAGLRARQLFELAEQYCRQELAREPLSSVRHVELVLELSRTLAEHALYSLPPDRETRFQQACAAADDFTEQQPDHPRRLLVEVQAALVRLSQGTLLRQEAQIAVVADKQARFQEAREQLTAAIGVLRGAADRATTLQREVALGQRRVPPGGLDELELRALANNIRYQLARAHRNQAQCFAAGSADHINELTRAVDLLEPLAKLPPDDRLAWPSRIELIECYRLLQDYDTAARGLAQLAEQDPPRAIQQQAQSERIQLALAQGDLDQALELLPAEPPGDGPAAAQLEYAMLQTLLHAWQQAAKWRKKAAALAERLGQQHGVYWGRRSGMLLASYVSSTSDPGDLELQVKAAESRYQAGQLDEALAAYDRARELALAANLRDRAFELAYTAAAIEHRRGRHADAQRRFREAALASPHAPRASDAHLMAAWQASQLVKASGPEALEAYRGLLEEHLEKWPAAESTAQARLWLGRLHEFQRDHKAAVEAYTRVAPASPHFVTAVAAAVRVYEAELKAQAEAGKATHAWAQSAAGWLSQVVASGRGVAGRSSWSPAARTAALALARIWLYYGEPAYVQAESLLNDVLADTAEPAADWRKTASALLVVSQAGQGRGEQARSTLAQLAEGSPGDLLQMLEGLAQLAASAPPDRAQELAKLELAATDLLLTRSTNLSPVQRLQLDLTRAKALAATGHSREALELLQPLARQHADNAELQEETGRMLIAAGDRASLAQALELWRTVVVRSRPGTPRWFRAKYYLALTHEQSGRPAEAAEIVTVTKLLHPQLGGPELEAKFLALLARCQ